MSLIMTKDGWKQLAPHNSIPAAPEYHEYRQPMIEHLGLQMTIGSKLYLEQTRAATNESRVYRGLRPLTDADVFVS